MLTVRSSKFAVRLNARGDGPVMVAPSPSALLHGRSTACAPAWSAYVDTIYTEVRQSIKKTMPYKSATFRKPTLQKAHL